MQVWLAKIHVRGDGPEVLIFRAELEEKVDSLPSAWNVSGVYTIEQVDVSFLVFAEDFAAALIQAAEVLTFLGVPSSQVALGLVHFGQLPTLSMD